MDQIKKFIKIKKIRIKIFINKVKRLLSSKKFLKTKRKYKKIMNILKF